MNPTNNGESATAPAARKWAHAWDWLSGPRLGIGCMVLLAVFLAASLGTSEWLRRQGGQIDPSVVSWLRMSGLTDGVRSPWFVSALVLLGLNLLLGLVNGISDAWAEAFGPMSGEGALLFDFETPLTRFSELAEGWVSEDVGIPAIRREVDEWVVFEVRRGRYNLLLRWLGHLAAAVALVGAASMMLKGFQARVILEEGARAGSLELLRGTPPMDWLPLVAEGKPWPGYWDPGFEIEKVPLPEAPLSSGSWLRFYDEGKLAETVAVAPGRPARFRDLTVHLLRYGTGGTQNIQLTVTDRESGEARRFEALTLNQNVDLEDFHFKVIEIKPATETAGASAQIEYQVPGHEAERFWVFADHPDYDFAHRKGSEQHFTLEKVSQRVSAELMVGREPGAGLLWGGLALMALFFWLALLRPEEKLWLRWTPGKVELTGWSPRPARLEPRFRELAQALMERADEMTENPDEAENAPGTPPEPGVEGAP